MMINEIDRYATAVRDFKSRLRKVETDKGIFIAYHSDADGIVGAALVAAWFKKVRGVGDILFHGYEHFRETEFENIKNRIRDGRYLVLVEGHGMPSCFDCFSPRVLNFDHHPLSCLENETLNPRFLKDFDVPCASQVILDVVGEDLAEEYEVATAFAAVMDFCTEPAQTLIEKHSPRFQPLESVRDIFLSCQYVPAWTNRIVAFLIDDPQPHHLVGDDILKNRRDQFRECLDYHSARFEKDRVVKGVLNYLEINAEGFRLASPLATNLSVRLRDRIILIGEPYADSDRVRVSIRNPSFDIDVGKEVTAVCNELDGADGTGHSRAASARLPRKFVEDFLEILSTKISGIRV